MLASIPQNSLSLLFGIMVLLAMTICIAGNHFPVTQRKLFGAGTFSGFMDTTSSIGGAPMALIYQRHEGPRLRGTLSSIFYHWNNHFFGHTYHHKTLWAQRDSGYIGTFSRSYTRLYPVEAYSQDSGSGIHPSGYPDSLSSIWDHRYHQEYLLALNTFQAGSDEEYLEIRNIDRNQGIRYRFRKIGN